MVIDRRALDGTGVSISHAESLLDSLDKVISDSAGVKLDDADDVGGGGTTQTVGFQLADSDGDAVAESRVLQFAAFDDIGFSVPAVNATLNTATAGTILGGAGSAALKVQTDTAGKFTCTLTNTFDTTVHLACQNAFGTPPYDDTDSVTFSA